MISKLVLFGRSGGQGLVLATGLMVCATPGLAAEEEAASSPRTRRPVPIIFQAAGGEPAVPAPLTGTTPITLQSGLLKAPAQQESSLFTQYRQALERESRRLADRNPTMFSDASVDEDGYPLRGSDRVQRDARRLFGGASSRVMSGWVEKLLDGSAGGRAARGAIEGLRVDLRRGGSVGVGAGPARESSNDVKASLGVVLLGRPRLEVRSTLPGNLRTRVEIPLDSLGVRATLSHKFTTGWRSTFTLGSEEDERWVSAGFEVDF
ncbi:MAG: hypothetical protein ACREAA_01020 [Candidatus Polarisedimenticolia bacterium]